MRPATYSVRHLLGMCLLDLTHILSMKHLLLAEMGSTSSIRLLSSVEFAFIRLKRRLKGIGCGSITGWTITQIGRWCVCGIGFIINFLHIIAMLAR